MTIPQEYHNSPIEYGQMLIHTGNFTEAIEVCEFLIQTTDIEVFGPDIFILMAQSVDASGDKQTAQYIISKAIELFPHHNGLRTCNLSILGLQEQHIAIPLAHESSTIPLRIPNRKNRDTQNIDYITAPLPQKPKKYISSMLSLIPGLEFTPITVHSLQNAKLQPSIEYEFPAFQDFSYLYAAKKTVELHDKPLNALEELAKRLENARIPAVKVDVSNDSPAYSPSIVTETMARIYERQGAYAQAIKVYQILARYNPDKLSYFEQKIDDLRVLINSL